MMKKIILLLIGSLILLSQSCKKDDDDNNSTPYTPSVYGKWLIISGSENTKYMILNTDHTFTFLLEEEHGFRNMQNGVYQVAGGQINFNGYYLLNYSLSQDQLILTHPELDSMICQRNDTIPGKEDWIMTASIEESISAPIDETTDIAYDGQYIWYGNAYESQHIYKINPVSLTIQETLEIIKHAFAVEWANNFLWVSSNGSDKIFQIDPATGTIVSESPEMGAWIKGIAYDGQHLWCTSNNERELYQYDPGTNTILSQVQLDQQVQGLCYTGGYLYCCLGGIVQKCSLSPFAVEEAFTIEKGYLEGIAYDGSNFWISAEYRNESPEYRLQKIALE